MKEKILAALRLKYKNLGFSEKAIDGCATYLEQTVTEEDKIDGAVTAVEPMLKVFQGEIDGRVTAAVKKAKEEGGQQQQKKEGEESTPDPNKQQEEVPAWAKTLIDANKVLETKLAQIEQGKSTDTRRQTLEAKLKDVSDAVKTKVLKDFGRMSFKDDDEFTAYLTETEEDVKVMEQNATNTALAQQSKPFTPGQSVTTKQVDDDIAAWAKQTAEPAKA